MNTEPIDPRKIGKINGANALVPERKQALYDFSYERSVSETYLSDIIETIEGFNTEEERLGFLKTHFFSFFKSFFESLI